MRMVLSLCCAAALFGCAPSSDYTSTATDPTTNVDVYYDRAEIEWDYEVIGEITGAAQNSGPKSIREKLAKKAEDRGADAILITETTAEFTQQTGYVPAFYRPLGEREYRSSYDQGPIQNVVHAQLIRYRRW